jgi:hypothetical protein
MLTLAGCKRQAAKQPTLLMLKARTKTIFNNFKKIKQMKTKKMSLANIQGKLSKAEMKNIMAGSDDSGYGTCCTASGDCAGYGCMQWIVCRQVFTKCSS